jgi:hypothetical protein
MKGGAGPYVYEDEIQLTLDNPFTHFAVNSNGDDTYNFNIPEKTTGSVFSKKTTPAVNFTSFCELYQYYLANSPISCVHQRFETRIGDVLKAPSFVDILGFILLLMGTEPNTGGVMNLQDDKFFKSLCLSLLLAVKEGPICQDQAGQLLMNHKLKELISKQIRLTSFTIHEMTTLPITSLDKFQIDRLLGLFKKVLFFYRYNTLPTAGYLTFERMSTTDKAFGAFGGRQTLDSEKFKEDKDKSYFRNNQRLYREDTLLAALSGTQAKLMALGGRGKTRVKRTNKNRRMRTRRSRTRRTRRRY